MPDSVRELIMKHLVSTLESITAANGYAVTLNGVERLLQGGQSINPPMAYVIEGQDQLMDDSRQDSMGMITRRTLDVGIELHVTQHETEDSRSASEAMNLLLADVQRAMEADPTRGGHAEKSEEMGIDPIVWTEGKKRIVGVIGYRIDYRHRRTDPRAEV